MRKPSATDIAPADLPPDHAQHASALDVPAFPTLSLQRLISLRWLSVLSMILAAAAGHHLSEGTLFIAPLLAVAAVMLSVNTCLNLALLLDPKGLVRTSLFAPLVQLGFDLIGWGAFVYYSGGASNPLIAVFLPLAAFGALVLAPLQAWVFGLASLGTYTFLWVYYVPLEPLDVELASRWSRLGMWTVFVVSTTVVIWFVSRMMQAIRQRNAALSRAREESTRNQWLIFLGTLAAGTAHQMSTPLGTLQILVDELRLQHRDDAALCADLDLMRGQIAKCKSSLTELTARAGNPRNETQRLAFGNWLTGLAEAWQSTQPDGEIHLRLAPALQGVLVYPDSSLDGAIQSLLLPARPDTRPALEIDTERRDQAVHLHIRKSAHACPSSSATDDHSAQQAAIEALGGRLSIRSGPSGESTISITIPRALLLFP